MNKRLLLLANLLILNLLAFSQNDASILIRRTFAA